MSSHGRRGREDKSPRRMIGVSVSALSDLMALETSTGAREPAGELWSSRSRPAPNFVTVHHVESGLLPRFFDRVTRQAFRDLALDDPPAAQYLTDLLTRFARTDALRAVQVVTERRLDTVADSLLAIQTAWDWDSAEFNPAEEPILRRHIGDYTLFMTGIFREYVERLAVTSYYELEGRRAYRFVSETARAGGRQDASLFRRLSDRFEQYAGALSYARKVYFRAEVWGPGTWPGDPFGRVFAGE